jgi:hypothetical protein
MFERVSSMAEAVIEVIEENRFDLQLWDVRRVCNLLNQSNQQLISDVMADLHSSLS